MDKIPTTTQKVLAQIMKFPDFSMTFLVFKIIWPICKISWLFPDLEEKSNFPDFSQTTGAWSLVLKCAKMLLIRKTH